MTTNERFLFFFFFLRGGYLLILLLVEWLFCFVLFFFNLSFIQVVKVLRTHNFERFKISTLGFALTFSNSPNLFRVSMKLRKHGKRAILISVSIFWRGIEKSLSARETLFLQMPFGKHSCIILVYNCM